MACQLPAPTPRSRLPASLKGYSDQHLIGTGALWAVAFYEPRYVAGQGIWATAKQPWFRLAEGQLTIDGHRADGGSGTFHAEIPPMEAYPWA